VRLWGSQSLHGALACGFAAQTTVLVAGFPDYGLRTSVHAHAMNPGQSRPVSSKMIENSVGQWRIDNNIVGHKKMTVETLSLYRANVLKSSKEETLAQWG
jgi:hypothetical protein